ncbi:MAG TPA: hypothetical protein VIA45_00570 [Thermoanaerobaculia bacterium]|jgi:hypothetical protein
MAGRFLIEVPHEGTMLACARVVDTFLKSGSHFLTRADWGCRDGQHKAWMIVDADDPDDARRIVPPPFRKQATIVRLNSFSREEIDDILRQHER